MGQAAEEPTDDVTVPVTEELEVAQVGRVPYVWICCFSLHLRLIFFYILLIQTPPINTDWSCIILMLILFSLNKTETIYRVY